MYQIRKAHPGEEKDIFTLVEKVLTSYGLSTDPEVTDKDISDLEAFYFGNGGWFAVVEDEGIVIGSYGIFRINEKTCELRKMYLLTEHQGRGLGKMMMKDAFKTAKQLGYSQMILETNKLLTKAIGLYRKYGFCEIKTEHLSDRCDLAMSRKL